MHFYIYTPAATAAAAEVSLLLLLILLLLQFMLLLLLITDKFVYLGSTVDSTGYSNTDILRRIGLCLLYTSPSPRD